MMISTFLQESEKCRNVLKRARKKDVEKDLLKK